MTNATSRTTFYVLAAVIRRAGNFLWLFALLAVVTPEELSQYGLLQSWLYLIGPAICLNATVAPSRLYFDRVKPCEKAELLSTSLSLTMVMSMASLCVLFLVWLIIGWKDPLTEGQTGVAVAICVYTLCNTWNEFALSLSRATGDLAVIGLGSIASVAIGIPIFLGGVFISERTPITAFCAASSVALFVVFAFGFYRNRQFLIPLKFVVKDAQSVLAFSAPTVAHILAIAVVNGSGRWIGAGNLTLEQLAPFSFLSIIAGSVTSIPLAIFDARLPDMSVKFAAGSIDSAILIANKATSLSAALVSAFYMIIAILASTFSSLIPREYQFSIQLILLFCLYNLLHVLYVRFTNVMYGLKLTKLLASTSILAAIVAVIASWQLVISNGVVGLALAMVVSIFVQIVYLAAILQQRLKQFRSAKTKVVSTVP